jgi:hypothetical protein
MRGDFLIQGVAIDPANASAASKQYVVGDYFSAMHMPLMRGGFLNSTDTNESKPVVVVDQGLSGSTFPKRIPLGTHRRWMGQERVERDRRCCWRS